MRVPVSQSRRVVRDHRWKVLLSLGPVCPRTPEGEAAGGSDHACPGPHSHHLLPRPLLLTTVKG